jgi:type I restriction enzyme S subunit
MELTKAYKNTDVGIMPEDWNVKELSNFLSFISYGFTNPMPTAGNGVFMITAADIKNGKILFETARCTTEDAYSKLLSDKSRPRKNDILLTKDGSLGRLAIVDDEKICINQSVAVLRVNDKVDPVFLKLQLESSYYQRIMIENAGGSTIKHIYITIVDKMKIAVPSIKLEQKIIASALSDTDAYITSLENLIEKKSQIKQGAMQELLKPKDGWETKKLGEFNFDISDGNYSSKYPNSSEFKAFGIPFIRANNIRKMSILDNDMRFISPELHSELKKGHLKKNDILLTTRGEIGQVALVPDSHIDSNINAQLVRINTAEKIDTKFLAYFFTKSETQNEFMNAQTGSALKQLPINKLKEIQINYPSISIQKNISQILYDIDKDLFQLECNLGKAKSIKQGMTQNLLTGKIRLL